MIKNEAIGIVNLYLHIVMKDSGRRLKRLLSKHNNDDLRDLLTRDAWNRLKDLEIELLFPSWISSCKMQSCE